MASLPLFDDVEGVLERARASGVKTVLTLAYDLASWKPILSLKEKPGVLLAFGLHPWVASQPLDIFALRDALEEGRAVAIGEIGLDFKIDDADRDRQIEVLRTQLDLAVEMDLPVLLHCRGASEELIAVLAEHRGRVRGVLHAFSRGPDLARRFLDMGLHLGFGGAITRPNAKQARRSAEMAPSDRIVLETDAPSIGLEGVAPEDTEPRHIHDIARALAEIRGVSFDDIAASTTANAIRLFARG